jgi:hypothetical protein
MNTKIELSILLWIKKNRKVNGKAPIFLRVTINGKRAEISTGRTASIYEWDARGGVVIGRTAEAKEVNMHIASLKLKLLACQSKIEFRGEEVTIENLKNEFFGITAKPGMLIEIMQQQNDDIKSLIGRGYVVATCIKYNATLKPRFPSV